MGLELPALSEHALLCQLGEIRVCSPGKADACPIIVPQEEVRWMDMTGKLHGESFVIVGKLNEVDWTTSTATLHPTEGPPKRVDLSRTLSAKKILQAQKREYRVKGRIIISFVDGSRTTRVDEIEDLEVNRATSAYKSLIPPEQQAKIAENSWYDRWSNTYILGGPTSTTFYVWLSIMLCHLIVFVREGWPDAGFVFSAIYFWIVYTFILGIFCAILFVTGWYFGTKFVYRSKLLRYARIAGVAAFLGASVPPNLVAVGILYGLVVHNWHCGILMFC